LKKIAIMGERLEVRTQLTYCGNHSQTCEEQKDILEMKKCKYQPRSHY